MSVSRALQDWFTSPVFENDDDNRIAGVLSFLSRIFIVGGFSFVLIGLLIKSSMAPPISGVAAVLGFVVQAFIRRRLIKRASLFISASLFAMFTIALLASGFGIFDVPFAGLILPVLVVGLLSGGRAALLFATLGALMGLGIVIHQLQLIGFEGIAVTNNRMVLTVTPADLVIQWSGHTAILYFTATLVAYVNRRLTNSLRTTRDSERMLTQRNAELQTEIAERKLAEQQVRELSLEKGRADALTVFISNISHDLKTPLSIINTSLYLLERVQTVEQRQEKIGVIQDQSKRLEQSIQDMITMARLDGTTQIHMYPVEINTLVEQVCQQYQALAQQKQITLSVTRSDTAYARGDVGELNRAVTSIVDNALNYTQQGGRVYVEIVATPKTITLKFVDDGIGISSADLPLIFNRLFRADKARSINSGGTGLGLAIVQKIIQLHGGEITVDSQADVGSTFNLILPRITQTEAQATFQDVLMVL